MAGNPAYASAVHEAVWRIRATIPADLGERFARESGITREDFVSCGPARCGEICAIDGSNVMLMESGSMALTVARAAQTTFIDMKRSRRSITPLKLALIGPEAENTDFAEVYAECFGQPPGTPLANDDRPKAAGILRDTLEYWVTEQMAALLDPHALLLRDGPLRVSHASHDPVLARIELACRDRDIDLAGVSKRTTATWGGGHPLLPSVFGLAQALEIPSPWWIRIDPAVLDHAQFPRWQHGQMYVGSLHPLARNPLKIDLLRDLPDGKVGQIMDRLAACSADGRIPGYPYPLFDAHRTVVLTEEMVKNVRSDLLAGISRSGIDRQTYDILFGDYHDEFARY
jgi:hypothetical protein